MAGTGGTISSYLSAEECTFRCLGVGSREVELLVGILLVKLPLEPRSDWNELLVLKPPECQYRELLSGLALADDGVRELFRGIRLGLGCVSRDDAVVYESCGMGTSACVVGGVSGLSMFTGIGGACTMLILFSLLASVGEMVLAPNPDTLPVAVDCRLLPDELGVTSLLLVD